MEGVGGGVDTDKKKPPPSPRRASGITSPSLVIKNTKRSEVGSVVALSVPWVKSNIVNQWIAFLSGSQDQEQENEGGGGGEDGTGADGKDAATKQMAAEQGRKRNVSLLKLLSYSTPYERFLMVVGLIMATLSGLGMPAWLILLAMALDRFSDLAFLIAQLGTESLSDVLQQELNKLVVAFFLVGVLALVSGSTYVALWTYTGEKQSLRIREKFVRSALKQDAEWFDSYDDREQIPTVINSSMIRINDAIGRQMVDTYVNVVASAGCMAVALVLNAPLALVMLCVVPVVGIVTIVFGIFVRRASSNSSANAARAGATATEIVTGIKTVTALCAQRWALDRYGRDSEAARKDATRSGILSSVMAGLTGCLFYLTYMMAFYVGTVQVADNSDMTTIVYCLVNQIPNIEEIVENIIPSVITDNLATPNCSVNGATVMVCIYGVILSVTFVGLMAPGIRSLNLGREAATYVFYAINRTPKIDSSSTEGRTLDSGSGRLELRNITFSYPSNPQNPIFFNFNLTIEPGQSVALVGPSGSGKSTVAKLLLRFYDPSSGTVLVDGVPIDELNIQWWRSQIGYVAQEPTLFPGSVSANIAAGKPGATQEEIVAAAKAACAHEFIKDLPDGYDTFYSGASVQLSGGQIQRISLARAMIRKPSILLLDEATSALDNASERQVQAALENIRTVQRVTTVSVSHRLSTICEYDQIAVIANGSVAELGTHRALIERGGIYATLCESQGITADFKVDLSDTAESPPSPVSKPEEKMDADTKTADRDADELQEVEMADLSRLKKYTTPYFLHSLLGYLGSFLVGALSPCESILTAQIVANFYTTEDVETLPEVNRPWILGFIAFAGASLIGHSLFGVGFSISGYGLGNTLKLETFEAIVRRPMGWFDVTDHSAGELSKLLSVDVEAIADESGWQRGYKLRMITSLLTGVIIALIYSWQIGLVAVACIPLVFGAGIIQVVCLRRQFVKETEGLPPTTILEQGLRGLSAVQAYNLQLDVGEEYSRALQPESEAKVKQGLVAGLVYGFSQFSVFASFAIVFLVGSILLSNGEVDFVHFFTPVLAVMFGAFGAAQVSAEFSSLQEARAAAARILSVLEEPPHNADPWNGNGQKPASLEGNISFESCSFHYPTRPDTPIFYKTAERDGFCLDINAKETVAFVGKSGCGKSTVQQLVLRFYEPSDGVIKIDGIAVQDLNIEWLRRQIGYVGQNPVLFSGTVRENILLGNPDATEDEIIAAAKAANAHDFVTGLSSGYDTDIGSGGSRLSGGQRQRLCIGRAIVSAPKIMVLDEATSALDNESQRLVQAALDNLQATQPRTTLTVAHRLTTIQDSNKIVVLGGGGVKQVGTHDSLLEEGGVYSELWKMQGVTENEVNMEV